MTGANKSGLPGNSGTGRTDAYTRVRGAQASDWRRKWELLQHWPYWPVSFYGLSEVWYGIRKKENHSSAAATAVTAGAIVTEQGRGAYGWRGVPPLTRRSGRKKRMIREKTEKKKQEQEALHHANTRMQKELVMQKLKERGCRITKQRLILLDIILEEDCSCCKEILYRASKIDQKIGAATVYRMVNALEEIGAISRKNMYKIGCGMACEVGNACRIELDDGTVRQLSAQQWNMVILEGMRACGYIRQQKISSVAAQPCCCASPF